MHDSASADVRRQVARALRHLAVTTGAILVGEIISLVLLGRYWDMPFPEKLAVDVAVTLTLAFPVLYFFSFRPLLAQLTATQRAEARAVFEQGRLQTLLDSLPVYVYLRTPDLSIRLVNREFRRRFGEPDERHCFEAVGEQAQCLECADNDPLEAGHPTEFDWTAQDGRVYRVFCHPFADADGSPLVLVLGVDVTRRRQAEEALREANEALDRRVAERTAELEELNTRLRGEVTERTAIAAALADERNLIAAILDTAGALVTVIDRDGRIERFNRACVSLTGYSFEEVRGRRFAEFLLTADETPALAAAFSRLTAGEFPSQYEGNWVTRGGAVKRIAWWSTGIPGGVGVVEHIVSVGVDVTEQRDAEERLRESLTEKEILLKEIHHRVKNNLQIIASMLNLQRSQVSDRRLLDILLESQNRVRTIALVHENLYRSKDLARIPFRRYLHELANGVIESYGDVAGPLKLVVDVPDVLLGVDVAIPVALIANELISNSVKHAFPGRRGGTIRVTVTQQPSCQFILTVGDDGVGLAAGFDLAKAGTLGFQLVSVLAKQIGSTVHVEHGKGCTVRVAIEAPHAEVQND